MNTDVKPNLIRPRWSKVLSDLWDDKTRTALVVASIAVGVFAIGMILTTYVILGEDINRSFAAVNPPNIDILTDPFETDLLRSLGRIPGVNEVEGRSVIGIRARRSTEDWQNLNLVAIPDFPGDIDQLEPIEGSLSPGDDQAVISQNMMRVTGFHTGDQIEIELPDGATRQLMVAGLATDQMMSKPDPNRTNNAYVTMKTLRSLGLGSSLNRLYVTVQGGASDTAAIAGVAATIKDRLENSQRKVYLADEGLSSEHPMTSTILAVIGVLGALGILVIILSSSLIINTLSALLTQQMRQIGIMKLVGGRRIQIMGMYLTLIIAYGVIALALAIPLGAIAGYGLAWYTAHLMGAVLQGFRVIPIAVLAQVLIALLVPLAAGFFPVNNGARTSVQSAISNYRPGGQAAKGRVLTSGASWFRWIPRPILLSFRNTFRKRGRLLLTIFTLTVSGAVFIAVFNVRDSISSVMDQLMQHFLGDVTVSFSEPYRVAKVEQTLSAIPGIQAVEGWGGAAGEIWDQNDDLVSRIAIAAPPQDTKLLHPEFVAGRWLLPGEKNALVVSDAIYDFYPDLKPGDSLTIKLPGRSEEIWKVVGVFRFVDMLGDPLAYTDFDGLAEKMHLPDQAASYRVVTADHGAAAQQALTGRIDTELRDRNFRVQSVQSGYLRQQSATQGINTLIIFLLIMALLTAFVGSIGLTGTMSINVLERTREIGVMRTIGAVDRVIMQSVIIEGLVIGLITWVLAILLSFPISYFLLKIVGSAMMGSAMTLTVTPLGSLVWLGVVIVLSVVASILPARKAARLTINEVLAYE